MIRIKVLILLLLTSFISYGQNIRPEIKELAINIAKDNVLKSEGVGAIGARTEQWERYEQLRKDATTDELKSLTDYKNPVVRCYAFQALACRKTGDIWPILIRHLYDTASVETFQGCIVSAQPAGDYFLDVVTPQHIDNNAQKLSKKERTIIDSILIFDKKIKLGALSDVLMHINPDEKYYTRIREIYTKDHNKSAIIALSKYRKQNDIPLITALLKDQDTDIQYYGLIAVRNFPDPAFFPFLQSIHSAEIKKTTGFDHKTIRMLYQAIVQYKNIPSRKLIEETLTTATGHTLLYHKENIWIALQKYNAEVYKGIPEQLKLPQDDMRGLAYDVSYAF